MDYPGAVVVDVVAGRFVAVCRRVADEGRRVEVEGGTASKVDASSLEKEEREERGGSRGGGVS